MYVCLYVFERKTEHERGRGRGRGTERNSGRFQLKAEPPWDHDLSSYQCLNNWATQVPLYWRSLNSACIASKKFICIYSFLHSANRYLLKIYKYWYMHKYICIYIWHVLYDTNICVCAMYYVHCMYIHVHVIYYNYGIHVCAFVNTYVP